MKDKIVHARLKSPTEILDVGCGTGIVTRHLGSIYPSASAYGIDISPVPPTTASDAISSTPSNVEYIIGDIRKLAGEDERLRAGNFDCIFQRLQRLTSDLYHDHQEGTPCDVQAPRQQGFDTNFTSCFRYDESTVDC